MTNRAALLGVLSLSLSAVACLPPADSRSAHETKTKAEPNPNHELPMGRLSRENGTPRRGSSLPGHCELGAFACSPGPDIPPPAYGNAYDGKTRR